MVEFYKQKTSRILAVKNILSTASIATAPASGAPLNVKGLTVARYIKFGVRQGFWGSWPVENRRITVDTRGSERATIQNLGVASLGAGLGGPETH
jgi:hypothetical protein